MLPKKNTHIRREEIVQAALQIIGEKGVHALTITEIAGRAGMSDANIYRHFKGKLAILEALGDFIGEAVMGKAAGFAAEKGTPLEKLSIIFLSHAALIAAHPGLPRFMFSEEVHLGNRELAAALAGRMAGYIGTLSNLVAQGISAGEFQPDISPRETALTLLGMIQFTALRWSITQGAFGLEAEAARLWENFVRLIRKQPMPPPTETLAMDAI